MASSLTQMCTHLGDARIILIENVTFSFRLKSKTKVVELEFFFITFSDYFFIVDVFGLLNHSEVSIKQLFTSLSQPCASLVMILNRVVHYFLSVREKFNSLFMPDSSTARDLWHMQAAALKCNMVCIIQSNLPTLVKEPLIYCSPHINTTGIKQRLINICYVIANIQFSRCNSTDGNNYRNPN